MQRTSYTFSVLQAFAATLALAIIMWSLGLPSIRFADAAAVTNLSDTVSTSEPSVDADHTIVYNATNGVDAGETIVITFDNVSDAFDLSSLTGSDVTISGTGVTGSVGSGWTATVNAGSPDTVTLTSQGAGGVVAAGATTTIVIGGTNKVTNPGTPGSYPISITSGATPVDTGETRVSIIDTVLVSATVDTVFTFAVAGVGGGVDVNGVDTTGGSTTPTTIPFGELSAGVASTAAQELSVSTNASNGFVVTAQVDGQLTSGGADIDSFINGGDTSSPSAWTSPAGTLGSENTYGHWGMSSDDPTLTGALTDLYSGGVNYVAASTSPIEVFRNNQPINGTLQGQGTTTVIYKVETMSLQEAGDYQAVLTYIATPVF
ncbi:hypothetical protein KC887_00090 [Candidatus Kaiserbacteria bacterium]|nr:hypothetical protein [Candidatus Kaiserbacteria bacterium]